MISYCTNGTVYYGDVDDEWHLYNNNYHEIVSLLVGIVKNLSSLRIEAPEWHPMRVKITKDED